VAPSGSASPRRRSAPHKRPTPANRIRAALAARALDWSRRRQGPDRFPLSLERRRLYILPSRAGLGFDLLWLGMVLAGLNYANSVALLAAFSLGGFALVGMYCCHRNLQGLRVLSLTAAPAFAGESGRIELLLQNDATVDRHGITVRLGESRAALATLAAGAAGRLVLTLPTACRGRLAVPPIRIASDFPFGLFTAWTWLHTDAALLVYPAARGALPPPIAASDRETGAHALTGGDDEWSGLRPFRDGDSPRQVAWKSYARGLPLVVKEYTGRSARALVFDFAAMAGLGTEQRLEQLARWVVDAEARGQRYALRLPAASIDESRGAAHRHRCLEALALHA
jgi:uncharacterized protein (DUF58 family)